MAHVSAKGAYDWATVPKFWLMSIPDVPGTQKDYLGDPGTRPRYKRKGKERKQEKEKEILV